MENKKEHLIVVGIQVIFLIGILSIILFYYPRTNVNVNGNVVNFESLNSDYIIISENPDFSNPRYIEFNELKNQSFNLNPGKYYYKSSNNLIKGFNGEFEIISEVGLKIEREGNDSNLVNIGNVKLNVTKEGGVTIGHIILEPEDSEKIEDEGKYTGREK